MEASSELAERLQSLLDGFVERQADVYNGLLLVEGPGFKWKGASGRAFPKSGEPMLPDDQFNIDSIAKPMTATIVMLLVEAGELGLDDRIGQFLPQALMEGLHVLEGRSYGEEISVRQLLSHTSGIPDDWAQPEFLGLIIAEPDRRWKPEETVEFVKQHAQPAFPPGGGFKYSDPGYNLLGLIIEEVTGRALHHVYRELLLEPLGMGHTYRPSHEDPRPSSPGREPSHRFLEEMECTLLPAVMTADWAGGGLISTAEDLNRFLRAFVANEIFEKPATRGEMFNWVESGPYHNYGFGIGRVDYRRSGNPEQVDLEEVWGHAGSSHNFSYYWPKEDVTVVGTLNQIACEGNLYDDVAAIRQAVTG
jgi:D-alanyl-D-alanine carboxypeptidase